MLTTEAQLFAHTPDLQAGIFSPQGVAYLRTLRQQSHLHTHMTLTREQWLQIDSLLVTVADTYLGAVMDLTSRGLTVPTGSIGVSASQYHGVGRMGTANRSLYASAAGTQERLQVEPHTVLLPFAYADYQFDITELEASQRNGQRLDLTHAEEAQRTVAEDHENLLINGSTDFQIGGVPIYGYRTHPGRAQDTAPGAWSTASNIFPTIVEMHTVMLTRKRLGPFAFYCNPVQWGEMHAEAGVDVAWNILRKLRESFPSIVSWRPISAVPEGELLLVELQRRTVDLVVRMDMANVPWEGMGGLVQHVRVLGSSTPRVKATEDDSLTGVVHYTAA